MSQIDPTGVENAGEEALLENNGQMSYEEI